MLFVLCVVYFVICFSPGGVLRGGTSCTKAALEKVTGRKTLSRHSGVSLPRGGTHDNYIYIYIYIYIHSIIVIII